LAIRVNHWQSEAINDTHLEQLGEQCQIKAVALSLQLRVELRQLQSVAISGNQWQSVALSGTQWH
jgi:hypothetical protein